MIPWYHQARLLQLPDMPAVSQMRHPSHLHTVPASPTADYVNAWHPEGRLAGHSLPTSTGLKSLQPEPPYPISPVPGMLTFVSLVSCAPSQDWWGHSHPCINFSPMQLVSS